MFDPCEDGNPIYVAHALVLGQNKIDYEVFCGLYKHRRNAYNGIKKIMGQSGNINWIPQVRVAEVLDCTDEGLDFLD